MITSRVMEIKNREAMMTDDGFKATKGDGFNLLGLAGEFLHRYHQGQGGVVKIMRHPGPRAGRLTQYNLIRYTFTLKRGTFSASCRHYYGANTPTQNPS